MDNQLDNQQVLQTDNPILVQPVLPPTKPSKTKIVVILVVLVLVLITVAVFVIVKEHKTAVQKNQQTLQKAAGQNKSSPQSSYVIPHIITKDQPPTGYPKNLLLPASAKLVENTNQTPFSDKALVYFVRGYEVTMPGQNLYNTYLEYIKTQKASVISNFSFPNKGNYFLAANLNGKLLEFVISSTNTANLYELEITFGPMPDENSVKAQNKTIQTQTP